ncbi:MAG: TonB-dependent receptor [Candidatus Omnitrophica bacterium]|nr:TonB-dependent receptor [Candidatus Omnitrophota bacterium]
MQNKKRRGLFFIIIILFSCYGLAFCSEKPSVDLESIVITKSKTHLFNSYCLVSDSLKTLSFSSLIESFSNLPLDLQSRSLKGGIQTDFSLRGSNFQGVLLLIDGQRINDPQTAHHNSDIPVTSEDIERVEVIPGLGSSLFGPDAIGGAVNIILKKPKGKKRILQIGLGQYETKSGLLSISEKIDDLAVRFSFENQESGGFYEDTDFKKFTSTLNSSLDIPDGEFVLNMGYLEKEFGAYDFYTPGLGYPSKEWTKTYLVSTGFNLDNDGLIIKPNFLWRRHYDKFMLDETQLRSKYLSHHRTDLFTPNIYFQKETEILGRIGLGLEYSDEGISSTTLGNHNRQHKSIFMDDSKDLNEKLSLGVSFRTDNFDAFNEVYTGSFGVGYKFSQKDSVRFGLSRSMRIPSFTELYYNDPTTVGNSGLSEEKSFNFQAGYDHKREGLAAGITFFLRQETDFIDWVKEDLAQVKWQAENIIEARVFGIENYSRLQVNNNISLDSNYTYIDKRIDDRGYLYKYGPNYIRHLVNIVLNFNLPFGVQTVGFTYKKKPVRDGWFLLNTGFSYNVNKTSQLFFKITNLLNVEYQEIEGIPQPGRWIESGFRFEW